MSSDGFFVAKMTTICTSLNIVEASKQETTEMISAYMKAHRFPRYLRRKIRKHYRQLWKMKPSLTTGLQQLEDLSPQLQREVEYFLMDDLIYSTDLLRPLTSDIMERIVDIITPVFFEPMEYIISPDTKGAEVFIIISGHALEFNDNDDPVARLGPGATCGEAIILEDSKMLTSVQAVTRCETYALPWQDVQEEIDDVDLVAELKRRTKDQYFERLNLGVPDSDGEVKEFMALRKASMRASFRAAERMRKLGDEGPRDPSDAQHAQQAQQGGSMDSGRRTPEEEDAFKHDHDVSIDAGALDQSVDFSGGLLPNIALAVEKCMGSMEKRLLEKLEEDSAAHKESLQKLSSALQELKHAHASKRAPGSEI